MTDEFVPSDFNSQTIKYLACGDSAELSPGARALFTHLAAHRAPTSLAPSRLENRDRPVRLANGSVSFVITGSWPSGSSQYGTFVQLKTFGLRGIDGQAQPLGRGMLSNPGP